MWLVAMCNLCYKVQLIKNVNNLLIQAKDGKMTIPFGKYYIPLDEK